MTRRVCEECGKRTREPLQPTVTGRQLCPACSTQLTGASFGVISSGGDFGQAIVTAGWYARLRDWRQRKH